MWIYKGNFFVDPPEGSYGFVYRITNTITGKMYIGKKQFNSVKRVKRKNKINRKVVRKKSNWKSYTGSNDELNLDIENIGIDKFRFEILGIAYSIGQLGYMEEYAHYKYKVIFDDKYYNNSVGAGRKRNIKYDDIFIQELNNL